jgi:hypothetical protein
MNCCPSCTRIESKRNAAMATDLGDRPFRGALIDVLHEEKDGKPKWQHLLETLQRMEKQKGNNDER